ncbi:tetratricopeptide repeat protein [Roseibacterium sp. SDUM158017]|uniref:tetratricopeptide repeat protein n=1 Tax=Roseicyclus salinarum TaxID=3036773 RepID=UPI002414E22A|nr:tetratricopeptide repeat protein [Roseibacterium sp. SDUM158017]MDG4649966.1 tetratricopeptide repeat protein [Roseibacterium sp. SDUM158017]
MVVRSLLLNLVVAAALCGFPAVAVAQPTADELLDRLAQPDLRNWEVVENQVYQAWSRSGSPSADYLLRRGRDAMERDDLQAAYDHLTALTDHAPDFAEGWNARATLLYQMGDYGPSIADIQRVLALEPRHFAALTGLGIMLEEMGEHETALQAFRQAHAIHPHRPDIEQAIGRIEQELEGRTL